MRFPAACCVASLALAAGWLPGRATPHELTDELRAQVKREATAFLGSYIEVLEGDDADAIRALFVADDRFVWYSDGARKYTSADEVLEGLAAMGEMQFQTESTGAEVVPLTPDLAHARTTFTSKILQGGAVVYEFSGAITWVLEQGSDEEWRVLSGHTSTPKPR